MLWHAPQAWWFISVMKEICISAVILPHLPLMKHTAESSAACDAVHLGVSFIKGIKAMLGEDCQDYPGKSHWYPTPMIFFLVEGRNGIITLRSWNVAMEHLPFVDISMSHPKKKTNSILVQGFHTSLSGYGGEHVILLASWAYKFWHGFKPNSIQLRTVKHSTL